MQWCGPDAEFAEWGMDDVPVLKQNLFLCNLDESRPTQWYDLQQIFLREHPRKEGEGMTLESVVTRMGIPMERPFHDALSDTLYTADVCRKLDLRAGLAAYPTEEESLRASLCPAPGDYRDFRVFRGYVEQSTWRSDPKIITASCPVCGGDLQPDDIWLKKGNSGWYTLSVCPVCAGTGNEPERAYSSAISWPGGTPALELCPLRPDSGRSRACPLGADARPADRADAGQGRKGRR